jgi:hypothetical protein
MERILGISEAAEPGVHTPAPWRSKAAGKFLAEKQTGHTSAPRSRQALAARPETVAAAQRHDSECLKRRLLRRSAVVFDDPRL